MTEIRDEQKPEFSESYEKCQAALKAVNELANHLEASGDMPNLYKANKAWKELYSIRLP